MTKTLTKPKSEVAEPEVPDLPEPAPEPEPEPEPEPASEPEAAARYDGGPIPR